MNHHKPWVWGWVKWAFDVRTDVPAHVEGVGQVLPAADLRHKVLLVVELRDGMCYA